MSAKANFLFASLLSLCTFSAKAAVHPELSIIQLTSDTNCSAPGYYYPAIDAKGNTIAFTSYCDLVPGGNPDQNAEAFVMNVDGTGLRQLTFSTNCLGSQEVGTSGNGERIVFSSDCDLLPGNNSDGNSEIFTVQADGSGLVQLTHSAGGDPANFGGNTHPRLDPAGLRVTFSSDRDLIPGSNPDGNHELFLMGVNGSGLRQLTSTTGGYGVFGGGSLDASGTKIVFDSDRDMVAGGNTDGNSDLFLMNVDGTGLTQLTNTTGGNGCVGPILSSNGLIVSFWSDRDLAGNNADADYETFHMDLDGSNLVQLTAGTGGFGTAPWGITGDGTTVSVESDRDLVPGNNPGHNFEIFLVRLRPSP